MAKKKTAKKKTLTAKSPDAAVLEVAKKLVANWDAAGEAPERRISIFDVASGLLKLVEANDHLPIGELNVVTAGMAIQSFQKAHGLKDDGVLGKRSFEMLGDLLMGCEESADNAPPLPAAAKAKGDPASGLLHYYGEPSFLATKIGGKTVKKLISTAIFNWCIHLDLRIHRTAKKDEANIIMRWKNLPENVLGRATIGGRDATTQLDLRFDDNQNWQEHTFLNTAQHELGHILGLSHVKDDSQLMGDTQNASIQEPQQGDIDRMVEIWGAS